MGFDPDEIIEASYQVIENAPMIAQNIGEFKGIELNPEEREVFAQAATLLMYDAPNKVPYSPQRLLQPKRRHDNGKDLWTTYNVVQENIMKGGISGMTFDKKNRPRRTLTRPVKSIDRNVKLNKALWTLTERMAELKSQ